ncbi:hypothetical protein [Bradyrhizobium sp.]|jgi:hypothetical protein|uniref:hypothetical protein n=1 Tax=Bradyrhizobium sp. TaxID=376 RepID=UPI002D61DDCD|nr:hypothetical protein [Bradyrhizobium sp.]HZR77257.1 hypothetical protein [Bradyrhizobium sp.]
MHAPYDKSRHSYRAEPKSGVGFFILPAILAFALIAFVIAYPKSSIWISQAVDAEFVGGGIAGGAPVETAQPGMTMPMRTVHAH